MRRYLVALLLILGCATLIAGNVPAAASAQPAAPLLYLRRGAIDPKHMALAPSTVNGPAMDLWIVQFAHAPATADHTLLQRAGVTPLLYLPEYAFLVRGAADTSAIATLPGVRWVGHYSPDYRLSPALDTARTHGTGTLNLILRTTPDADGTALVRWIMSAGGRLITWSAGGDGATVHAELPAAQLPTLAQHGDLLWGEPYIAPRILNDRARGIVGATTTADQYALSGAGQIIAITDTGLDVQENLSADFRGRVILGVPPTGLRAGCGPSSWSDIFGHGTHVAGIAAGSGALSGGGFAGIAPEASLVIQNASSGSGSLACLPPDATFLAQPYAAGARIHNASFGAQVEGAYIQWDADIDRFLWEHPDLLLVVAAGNFGTDLLEPLGSVDHDSMGSPGTAKNVLTVGASESNRWDGSPCGTTNPVRLCWQHFSSNSNRFVTSPLIGDPISDDPTGIAAFSSRGPADDGRIKPEIVAPGTTIISTRSHHPSAGGGVAFDANYSYRNGTSMAAPVVSGLAALVREWLARERELPGPTAALVKALLLNGAADISPGQYGAAVPEIPPTWPNSVAGWGRANLAGSVEGASDSRIWFAEGAGITTGAQIEFELDIASEEALRATLVWTDYPGSAATSRALVNDLDFEIVAPGGALLYGNATADMTLHPDCRSGSADRCNTSESIVIATPTAGRYTLRVRGAVVPAGTQPFALVVRAAAVTDPTIAPPSLTPIVSDGPILPVQWQPTPGATRYHVQVSDDLGFGNIVLEQVVHANSVIFVRDPGSYVVRVRACAVGRCGGYSAVEEATLGIAPSKIYAPIVRR